jgi:hypothetical protein
MPLGGESRLNPGASSRAGCKCICRRNHSYLNQPLSSACCMSDTCETCALELPELYRDDAALRDLLITRHLLTPDIRATIMQLVRGSR